MRKWMVWTAAFALLGGAAWAQGDKPPVPDDKFRPDAPEDAEPILPPEEALKMLKEVEGLMDQATELLHDSSYGKSLETEKELLAKIDKLLDQDPAEAQKRVLAKIEKLLSRTQGNQSGAVDKINEIIRRARDCQGPGCKACQQKQGQKQQRQQQANRPQQPGSPAPAPYDPNRRDDPLNRYRSKGDRTGRWGDLPSRIREAMFTGDRSVDDYPAEMQQVLKEFMEALSDIK